MNEGVKKKKEETRLFFFSTQSKTESEGERERASERGRKACLCPSICQTDTYAEVAPARATAATLTNRLELAQVRVIERERVSHLVSIHVSGSTLCTKFEVSFEQYYLRAYTNTRTDDTLRRQKERQEDSSSSSFF